MSGMARGANGRGEATRRVAMKVAGTIHTRLYRVSDGKVGGSAGGMPVLLFTTTGRKTGRARTWPLGYVADGDRIVVVASALGQANHPAWYLNLRANPRVTVRRGVTTRAMVAETARGDERARLWSRLTREYPHLADHQRKTSREIPVVLVRPAPGESPFGEAGNQG